MNIVPTTVVTSYPNGQQNKVSKTYDAGVAMSGVGAGYSAIFGDIISQKDYDYGNGAAGPLLRTTTNAYEFQINSSYLTNNLLDIIYTTQVQDGSGVQDSLTQYNYDETTRASSGLTSAYQFDSTPPAGGSRGNNTSVYRWLNSGTFTCPNGKSGGSNGYLKNTKTYFDDGSLNTAADPCGDTTTYAYSLNYWDAFPTSVTNALNQPTTNTYDFNTGLLTSVTDPNNLTTNYTYDSMERIHQVTHPDGGQENITHQESAYPFSATLTTEINSSQSKIETNIFDGLGRVTENRLTSDPQGSVLVDTTYDAVGHVATESNPYRAGTDATSTPGTTTYGYDALNRKKSVTYPGNTSVLKTAYCGAYTLVTDPTGKWRRSRADGLGRLVEVDEPNALGVSVNSNGCASQGDPVWVTSYTLDPLGNLTKVVQNGSHTRTFSYDSVSRLLTSFNPENGQVTYAYNPDGTVLKKTDARGIAANYTWDAI